MLQKEQQSRNEKPPLGLLPRLLHSLRHRLFFPFPSPPSHILHTSLNRHLAEKECEALDMASTTSSPATCTFLADG